MVTVPDNGTLNIDFTNVKAGSTVNNVLLNAGLSSGAIKGKGQLITFILSAPAQITVTTVTTGYASPDIYDSYGKVWVEGFNNTVSLKLPAGTYVISAGQKDKEASITALTFADSGASSDYRINAAKTAMAAIPSTVTLNSESVINEAAKAYGALIGEERNNEDIIALYPRYAKATEALTQLQIAHVIARIDYIGEVTQGSYNKINAAQIAYMDLAPRYQAQITNYNLLTAAWAAYEAFAAQNVINKLLDLPDLTSSEIKIYKREALDKLKDWFNAVNGAYNSLTSDSESTNQQAVVRAHNDGKTYKKLTDGLAEIEQIEKLFDFKDELEAANTEEAVQIGGRLNTLYNSLTETQKAEITGEAKAKFDEIMKKYAEVASKRKVLIFNEKSAVTADGDFWTFKGTYKDGSTATINGTEYTGGLKFDKNGAITFTTATKMTLKVYFTLKSKIALDGDASKIVGVAEGDHYVGTVTVEAGTHTLSKGKDGESAIFMVELTPAN